MNKEELINIDNLSVKYQQFEALKNISFSINRGDFIAIVGANGSGKTTLIKSLMGLLRVSSGKVTKLNDLYIGYLPQNTASQDRLFPSTVEEVVSTGLMGKKTFPKMLNANDKQLIKETLEYMKIPHLRKKRIGSLSGGQQQRVLLARALVTEPDILILDEPTSALDQSMRSHFFKVVEELNQTFNMTILLVTHDIVTTGDYINRVVYLDQTLKFDGTFDEFCEDPELSPFVHTHPLKHREGWCKH